MTESKAAAGYLRLVESAQVVDTAPVGSKEWSENIRAEAQQLARQIKQSYWRLAKLIYEVYNTHVDNDPNKPPLYLAWGYDSLEEWAAHELDIDHRKTMYLRRIHYILHVVLVDLDPEVRAQIKQLSYSKVRELVSVLTYDTAKAWAEMATNLTYRQLMDKITPFRKECREKAQEKVEAGEIEAKAVKQVGGGSRASVEAVQEHVTLPTYDPDDRSKKYHFRLYDDQLDLVEKAVKAAAAFSGNENRGYNITHVCMDFLATHGGARPGTESFHRYLGLLGDVFGVNLVAFERLTPPEMAHRAPRIMAGAHHLSEIVQTEQQRAENAQKRAEEHADLEETDE